MKLTPVPPRVLKITIVLAIVFDVLALLVMVDTTPIMFTLFMFIGQPLFAVAVLLILAAQLIDLRTKELLSMGFEPRLAGMMQTYYCPWHAQPIGCGAPSWGRHPCGMPRSHRM